MATFFGRDLAIPLFSHISCALSPLSLNIMYLIMRCFLWMLMFAHHAVSGGRRFEKIERSCQPEFDTYSKCLNRGNLEFTSCRKPKSDTEDKFLACLNANRI